MGLITLVMCQFGNGNPLKGHNGGVKGIRWKRWLALSWDRSSWPVVAGGAKLPTCIFNQSRLAGDTKLWRGGETAKGGEKNHKGGHLLKAKCPILCGAEMGLFLFQDLPGHFSRGCFLNTTEDRIEEECDYMEFRNLPCATTSPIAALFGGLVGMVLFLSICREGAPLALRDQVPPSVQALGFLQFLLQGTSG
ncbi:hypothetical protein Ancab_038848 [Ancistrocladus abbreviatus]